MYKEIRSLSETLTLIEANEQLRDNFKIGNLIAGFEEGERHCGRNHKVVIRRGPETIFWGAANFLTVWAPLVSREYSSVNG